MQQELLNRADSIFAYIGEAAAKAADFAGQQIPDIAYQYIAYYRTYLSIVVGVALVVLFIQQFLMIKFCRYIDKELENKYNDGGHWFAYAIVTLFVGFICIVTIITNLKELIMVWVAPKVFLIEHIVHLVKG